MLALDGGATANTMTADEVVSAPAVEPKAAPAPKAVEDTPPWDDSDDDDSLSFFKKLADDE